MVHGKNWPRTIGIVGGMGPHAHLVFERYLLEAAGTVAGDQGYPPWMLSSLPGTPDRTAAVKGGESPVPWLVKSLRNLEGIADFAVVICHTAHVFLDEAASQVEIPVLSLVRETVIQLDENLEDGATVGVLATTGTLESGIYPMTAANAAPRLRWLSLLDMPKGRELQRDLVMAPIYGREGRGGLKTGLSADPQTGIAFSDTVGSAADLLFSAGCSSVILACTELPLALADRAAVEATLVEATLVEATVVDPLRIAADRALDIAAGRAPLPDSKRL